MLVLSKSYVDSISHVVPEFNSGGIKHILVTPQGDAFLEACAWFPQTLSHTASLC